MRAVRALGGVLLVVGACRGGSAPEARLPPEPSAASGVLPLAVSNDAGAPRDVPAAAIDEGMPRLSVVLDDPRLTIARERDGAHDPSGAARALDAARATATLDAPAACAWAYLAGRLHVQAGENDAAVAALDQAVGSADAGKGCPLAPYAMVGQAQALVRSGHFDQATARLAPVVDDAALHEEARLTLADAYVGKRDRAPAVALWRALLAGAPHGVRWADSSLQLAAALLDGVDGPAAGHAQEALDLATRVLVEAPAVAEKADLDGLRARAAATLHLRAAPPLTPDERARQAQAWLDLAQPRRAMDVAEALLAAVPVKGTKHREAACKAAVVRAQASPRGQRGGAADIWAAAIERCEGQEPLVTALYYGAKASASARRDDEALLRFGRVEKEFPSHRLADDARVRAAQVVREQGDVSRYVAMLSSVADSYPDGDMRGEALFRVAVEKLVAHDLDGARATLDRLLTMPSDDHASGSPGRAAYFRARVSQLAGDVADARARYLTLVDGQALSFYMLLAYQRLHAIDADAARVAIDRAVAREGAGPFLTTAHPELASPSFDRFQRLLEVGEIEAARHEASAGGLVADGVDPEVLWTVAWSYDRSGAHDLGHSFARGRLTDFRSHWPAGRWRLAWEVAFPRPWDAVVTAQSAAAGIPAPLTWSIMREESAFNPDARSPANAFGLMQLLVGTGKQVARGTSLLVNENTLRQPEVSIALGARLLSSMRASFASDPALAIAAYNCGSSPVHRWLGERGGDDFDLFVERIPFDETRNYIKRVLTSEAAYAYLYAPDVLKELLALPERAGG